MPEIDVGQLVFNLTQTQQELGEWVLQGYIRALGGFFFPMFFAGIVTYVYMKNQSAVSAAVGILLIFSAFVGSAVLLSIPGFVLLMQGIVILAFAGLITYFFIRRRQ